MNRPFIKESVISRDDIRLWLKEEEASRLDQLWSMADHARSRFVGQDVHFRGLIEMSSHCRRNCLYCGIRAARRMERYRMTKEEVLQAAKQTFQFGYGTVVIQAGEDTGITKEFICDTVMEIKDRFGLAVTLSLGERTEDEWIAWKRAGADRYLLRFETSNPKLFRAIHPGIAGTVRDNEELPRVAMLRTLREMGYEIGSGVMVGIPGQTIDDLVNDIDLFRRLDLDMIGCGPYLPHPDTPLGCATSNENKLIQQLAHPDNEAVDNSNDMAFKVIALTRLVCPLANIPSTTAIATMDSRHGRTNGLSRGANVIMPNMTPRKYRALYEIYPNKSAVLETSADTHQMAVRQVESIGRRMGTGPGSRKSHGCNCD